jgi:transposase-like protein
MTAPEIRNAAVDAILDNDQATLRRLDRAFTVFCAPTACPDCGSTKIEDNGLPGKHWDFTYLCPACGCQWCPNA